MQKHTQRERICGRVIENTYYNDASVSDDGHLEDSGYLELALQASTSQKTDQEI
jgi:hypothetical protein